MPSRKKLFPEMVLGKPKKRKPFNPIGFLMGLDMENLMVDTWIKKNNGKKKHRKRVR